jgi:hypothetical protein
MPGKEIKGRSKIANYRHGGRTEKQFGGPLTQPGVAQPLAQPLARPGVARPGVMPTRPLGYKHGKRVRKAKKRRPKSPTGYGAGTQGGFGAVIRVRKAKKRRKK